MHTNPLWKLLLLLIACSTFGYAIWTGYLLMNYWQYDATVLANSIEWSIKEKSENEYRLHAIYTYEIDGNSYQGQMTLPQPTLLNPWSAATYLEKVQDKAAQVWYQRSNPHNSTLQRKFPTKECLSTVLLLGIVAYFFGLGYYVSRITK